MTIEKAKEFVSAWLWDGHGGNRATTGQPWGPDHAIDAAQMIIDANPVNIDELKIQCRYAKSKALRHGRAQQAQGIVTVVNLIENMEARSCH